LGFSVFKEVLSGFLVLAGPNANLMIRMCVSKRELYRLR